MTQEIYSYLLIRNYLIQENSEYSLEGQDNAKEQYAFFVNTVAELMQRENYPLIADEMQKEINHIVQKYRFDYINDKKINEDINFIITRLHEYESLSENRKLFLIKDWYKEEYENRLLPRKYRTPDYINLLLSCDFHNFEALTSEFTVEGFTGCYKLKDADYSISKYASFLSTMNLMINHDDDCLSNEEKARLINNILVLTKELELTITDIRYGRKTANNIFSTMKQENVKEKRLVK